MADPLFDDAVEDLREKTKVVNPEEDLSPKARPKEAIAKDAVKTFQPKIVVVVLFVVLNAILSNLSIAVNVVKPFEVLTWFSKRMKVKLGF